MSILIPFLNELANLGSQVVFGFDIDDSEPFALQDAEPLFDLIHPRTMHGGKVEDQSGMFGEPLADLLSMMCADIVTHEMNVGDMRLNLPVQLFQKGDACLLPFAVIALPIDLARAGVKGGKEIQGPGALVLVLALVGQVLRLGR